MTREQNVRAIIETHFAGFKEEIIDSAVNRILELHTEVCGGREMTFKVGDKVITTKDHDECGIEVFPIGTVGIIKEIRSDTDTPYKVGAKSDYWWYTEDMLEPYGEAKQTKTTEVRGERYDPNKADAMIGSVGDQIKAVYGWGYKDGNLDGQEIGYPRGYNDAKREISLSGEYERAYQRGFEDGKNCEDKWNYDGAAIYHLRESGWLEKHDEDIKNECGEEALRLAREAREEAYDSGIEKLRNALIAVYEWDNRHKVDVFHGAIGLTAILKNHTGQYIINQVRQHEKTMALMATTDKESEPINVGDEVLIHECDYDDTKAVVIDADTNGTLWVLDDNGCVSEISPSDDRSVIKTERHFNEIRHILNKLRED